MPGAGHWRRVATRRPASSGKGSSPSLRDELRASTQSDVVNLVIMIVSKIGVELAASVALYHLQQGWHGFRHALQC
jgi:hypothetical protein